MSRLTGPRRSARSRSQRFTRGRWSTSATTSISSRSRADGSLHALLADPAALDELRTLLCQVGAARLLALMHFLSENAEPGSAPLPVVLSRAETAEALALRSALRALSRRFTLQRMFSPERLSALRTAIADANKEAFQ